MAIFHIQKNPNWVNEDMYRFMNYRPQTWWEIIAPDGTKYIFGDPTTTNDYLTNPYYNETTAGSQVKHIYSYGNITSEYINSPDKTSLPWAMSSSTWNLKEIYIPIFPRIKSPSHMQSLRDNIIEKIIIIPIINQNPMKSPNQKLWDILYVDRRNILI